MQIRPLLSIERDPSYFADLLYAVPRASAVADGFRWRAAVRQLPDSAQPVVLTVQAVERQFSPAERDGSTRWEALLARYYKALWACNDIPERTLLCRPLRRRGDRRQVWQNS